MKVNIEQLNTLLSERFRNNQSFMADTIGVDRRYLSGVLGKRVSSTSPKICNCIIKYCELNNLDYHNYIFLD